MPRPEAVPAPHAALGAVVGDFVLGEPIAEGALGTLHAATRRRDEVAVALRIVPAERIRDDASWQRFLGAASKAWQAERRHVAPILGHGRLPDGSGWVASALAEGRTLAHLLRENPLEPAELLAVLRGVCRALEGAHRAEVFHGDLSPASVCIGSDADGRMRAKVLELGGAVLLDGGRSRSGPVTRDGAPYPPFDVSRDLRALGALAYEALAGVPFEGEVTEEHPRLSDERPELGPHFDEPVHALLVPSEQPESAAEAHARMVEAARAAGYDVGAAIPPAPREATPSSPRFREPAPVEQTGVTKSLPSPMALLGLAVAAVVTVLVAWMLGR